MRYVFHAIVPASQIWQTIISKTNIINIFPASVPQDSVAKIIHSNCILQSKKYVPARPLCLNRVFTDLANSHEKHCLTTDCSYTNKNGPGRYRSSADNPEKQVCYFNKPNEDVFYKAFLSERIKGEKFDDGIYFKIEKVRGKTDKKNFDAKRTLEDSASNARSSESFNDSKSEQNGAGILKKVKTSTKDKTRNLLTNVSYRSIKQFDFNKNSFIIDILSFSSEF